MAIIFISDEELFLAYNKYSLPVFAQKIFDKCVEEIMNERENNLTADNYYNSYLYNGEVHFSEIKNIQEDNKEDNKTVIVEDDKTIVKNIIGQPKKVYQYSLKGYFMKAYDSIAEAAKLNNRSPNSIGDACHGRSKTSGGFMWSLEKKKRIKISHLKISSLKK